MKTDARVRYTKHIIEEVFIRLLKEKPLSKITVKEICEEAEINRGTFYKHYEDVYDLMRKLEDSALEKLLALLSETSENGNYPVLVDFLTSLAEQQDLIASLAEHNPGNDFIKRLSEQCSQFALAHLLPEGDAFLADEKKQNRYSYLVGGTASLIEYWLKTGAKDSPVEIAEQIESLNQKILS